MKVFRATYRKRNGNKAQSKKYYIDFYDHQGRRHKVAAFTSIKPTRDLAVLIESLVSYRGGTLPIELQMQVERLTSSLLSNLVKWGLLNSQRVESGKLVVEHIIDYKLSLQAKGCTTKYIKTAIPRVEKVMKYCKFTSLSNIDSAKVEQFISKLTKSESYYVWEQDLNGNSKQVRRTQIVPISKQTKMHFIRACKQFGAWLADNGRVLVNPLSVLRCQTVLSRERVIRRRTLTSDELRCLLAITAAGNPWRGISGRERSLVYRLAVESGLRANEIRQLQKNDFDFKRRTVVVKDYVAKNRKADELPLKESTTKKIEDFLSNKLPEATAFNVHDKTALMIQYDLELANIKYKTDDGTLDFHCLRHTFATQLANSGVHVKTAQKLLRHSKADLTLSIYTHSIRENEEAAINSLPDLDKPVESQNQKSTGTDGKPVDANFLLPVALPKSDDLGGFSCTNLDAKVVGISNGENLDFEVKRPFLGVSEGIKEVRRRRDSNPGISVLQTDALVHLATPPYRER